jgi:hypothetical protein
MKTFPSLCGGCGGVPSVEWARRPSDPGKEQIPHSWSFPVKGPQIRRSAWRRSSLTAAPWKNSTLLGTPSRLFYTITLKPPLHH